MYDEVAKQQMQYLGNAGMSGVSSMAIQPTLRQRLERQKAELTERITAIDEALTALDATPDFETCMNAVAKAQIY